jgi:hypothetical protein
MINLSFESFEQALNQSGTGLKAYEQSKVVYFVKVAGRGKVELNLKSGTILVGSGASEATRDEVTEAAVKAGFKLVKRTKGWSVFAAEPNGESAVDNFLKMYGVVASTMPVKTVKLSTLTKRAGQEFARKKTVEAAAQAKLVKAKNLETIKAVAAKLKAA